MRCVLFLALLTLTWLTAIPSAMAVEYPLTPDPATCDAEPVDIDALVERAATPVPSLTPEPPTDPRSASPQIQDQMMEVVIGSVACTNANRPLHALSFFTEDYLLHRVSDEPAVTLGHLKAAATRRPDVAPPEDRVTIEIVENATTWPGGAEVVLLWSNGGDLNRVGLRFRDIDGDWKIDEVLAEDAGSTGD